MPGGGALTIYAVLRVCQHQGCDFDKKCKRKGIHVFWKKMPEKGCVLGQRMNYSTIILENFRRYAPFFNSFVKKGVELYLLARFVKKNSMFS